VNTRTLSLAYLSDALSTLKALSGNMTLNLTLPSLRDKQGE